MTRRHLALTTFVSALQGVLFALLVPVLTHLLGPDPDRAGRVAAQPVDGVGLLRAEFLITSALQGLHPRRLIAEGRTEEQQRLLAEKVYNRSDDGSAPVELPARTSSILSTTGVLRQRAS